MNLKLLAFLTIIISLVFTYLVFVYSIPITYVPSNASAFEYVLYSISCIILEVIVLTFLFLHMLEKSKIELSYGLIKIREK